MKKPAGCIGCPMYQDGFGFVADEIRPNAPLVIYMQSPGEEEEEMARPAIGKTGEYQDRTLLPKTGLTRQDVSIMNALRCRWRGHGNELPPINSTLAQDSLRHCNQAYGNLPPGARLIIATGDYAALTTTGEKVGGDPSDSWRGYVRPHLSTPDAGQELVSIWTPGHHALPVLLTQHTAFLFRSPEWTPVVMRDWGKAARILRGTWPKPAPPLSFVAPTSLTGRVSFDTEYTPSDTLVRWSAAKKEEDGSPTVWVIEAQAGLASIPVEGAHIWAQNLIADWGHWHSLMNRGQNVQFHDTMLAHQVLYSDLPHNLNFLGSIYSSMNRWKHLSGSASVLYSGADAWGTLEISYPLEDDLDRDPQSKNVYLNNVLPLVPIIYRAQKRGMRVWPSRLQEVMGQLRAEKERAITQAHASVGWPINVGSPDQVRDYLYRVLQMSPGRKA